MNFLKKQSAGFYLAAITTVFAIAGLVFYYINCNTDYFGNLGVSLSQRRNLFKRRKNCEPNPGGRHPAGDYHGS